jgi:LmbE family N-acetylglucosaminyl deacetylase
VAFASVPDKTEIWGYEVWATAPANRLVDVTKVWDRKDRALAAHSIPASVFDTTGHLALNRWRSIHGSEGSGYMEAFLALTFSSYKTLALKLEAEPSQSA